MFRLLVKCPVCKLAKTGVNENLFRELFGICILGRDDKDVGSAYVLHHRHDMVKSLGGYLFTWYITFESIKTFVQRLGTAAGDSSEDISNSLRKVEETWKRGINEQPIIGKSGLIEAFARLKEGDLSFGQERLALLTKALRLERNIPRRGGGKENDADILVKIADREIPFFFMNHLNRACVVVKVQQHYEVMEINTDPFLIVLRRIWQSAHPNRITISDEMVKRARSALIAMSINTELPTIKTYQRVAWKEKDKIYRYDLTNSLWQQIEVSSDGRKLLSSKVMLDEIKEYKESGYANHKTPVFFQRYSNTNAQVLPVEDFEPDILDRYFEESTNVTDKRAVPAAKRYADHWKTEASMNNDTKLLTAKVLLISKFIPNIPHFLQNVIGSPGAIKTSYAKKEGLSRPWNHRGL
ncbi:MAG: hypothetical protein WBZ36_09040 [Candidatus Nitrosopolaris sp.]